MTIETKFNVGENVWIMFQNRACNAVISEIDIEVSQNQLGPVQRVSYGFKSLGTAGVTVTSQYVFESKEVLLASL